MFDVDAIPVADAVRAALDVAVSNRPDKLVVAVSGGRDSMALMHALARWHPGAVAAVATFDHGSGAAATDAAALVAAEARRLGLTVIRERARQIEPTEDAWRTARWSFLKRVARGYRAAVATAHTRDDQLETIVLRLMRGAGARGLAALAAPSPVTRPWLPLTRAEVAQWAAAEGVPFVDDPTNHTRQYFRSRVRLDLLPALEQVDPGFGEHMLAVGERAAALRRDIDRFVHGLQVTHAGAQSPPGSLCVAVARLAELDDAGRAMVWPALLARVGVALNRRGTNALVAFTTHARRGMRLALAGGASVLRVRSGDSTDDDVFEFRAPPGAERGFRLPPPRSAATLLPPRFGGWRFVPLPTAPLELGSEATLMGAPASSHAGAESATPAADTLSQKAAAALSSAWVMPLATDAVLEVRAFQDGDRIRTAGAPAGRRVARYLTEARIPPIDRPTWPVVVHGNEIVWVPGVCRSSAAPYRSGRPAVTWYRCEREHG